MPTHGIFSICLICDGTELREITDTKTGRCYAVSEAGKEYKIRMTGDSSNFYGAIVQVDGQPSFENFAKSPFTYFRKPYEDPGFWTEPSKGLYKARVFTLPKTVSNSNGAATATSNDDIGSIRVYFFNVEPRDKAVAHITKQYSTPGEASKQEDKKWYLASQSTRYGSSRHVNSHASTKSRGYQIIDRTNPIAILEIRYKDKGSLELLGWDGEASAFEFMSPWERERKRKRDLQLKSHAQKKGKLEVVDLTNDSSGDEEDAVVEAIAPKTKVEAVVIDE
eukprot:m.769933 g.769933  ORF g.769933 m.769933 type:complete len:279 (+) comp23238_c2_seq2:179-1015(+)